MGVCEGLVQFRPGMHWQHHQDKYQQQMIITTAYDPSRDLSPNLPTTTSSCPESMSTLPNAHPSSHINNGCSIPLPPTTPTRIAPLGLCSYKEEYESTPQTAIAIDQHYSKVPIGSSDCQDCALAEFRQYPVYPKQGSPYERSTTIMCKTETVDSSGSYPCSRSPHQYSPYDYRRPSEYCSTAAGLPPEVDRSRSPTEEDSSKVCAGCGRRISDRFYLYAVDRQWHVSCLQCCQCGRTLDDEVTCFARDGNIYCRKDYQRLFGMNRCSRCKATISSTELVMRAKDCVFHLPCFFCVICMTVLTKGDHFGMRDGEVYCRLHYEALPPDPGGYRTNRTEPSGSPCEDYPNRSPTGIRFLPAMTSSLSTMPSPEFASHSIPPGAQSVIPLLQHHVNQAESGEKAASANFYNGVSAPRPKGRPRKRKPKDIEQVTGDMNSDSYLDTQYGGGSGLGSGSHNHQRTKRMRTSFKHHQLRTMKTYFTVNHNPDAKDLKQLSQKTGLAKRVLQVWFQNARAKWRRMLNKQDGATASGNSTFKNVVEDKSCSESSTTSVLDPMYHHHHHHHHHRSSSVSLGSRSPSQAYLSPTSSLDCGSSS